MKRTMIAAGLVMALSATALAEDIWVKAETVEIREGKGAIFKVVGTAAKGTQLSVVAREGKWIKVKAGASEGWVFEEAVSPAKVSGGGNIFSGMTNTATVSSGAAAKGLEQNAEVYAKDRRMDAGPMNWLVAFSHSIPPAEWQRFTAQGKVGPDAGR